MWVFTEQGFYSVVEKGPVGKVCVRTRVKADIENLRSYIPEMGQVLVNAATDYPYRVFVRREEWTRALARMSDEISSSNFKNRVHEKQGADRAHLYGRVWSVMYDAERPKNDISTVAGLFHYLTEPVEASAELMEYANDAYYEAAPAPKKAKAKKAPAPKKAASKAKKPAKKAPVKVSKRK